MLSFIARFRRKLASSIRLPIKETKFPNTVLIGIGMNAVAWGYVESGLDILCAWHAETRMGENRPDHPRALCRKLRYLKTIESDAALDQADRDSVKQIRILAADISQRRHDFTHSFMDIPQNFGDWIFVRFRYEGQNIRAEQKTYNLDKLMNLTREIGELNSHLSPLCKKLASPWMNKHLSLSASSEGEKPNP